MRVSCDPDETNVLAADELGDRGELDFGIGLDATDEGGMAEDERNAPLEAKLPEVGRLLGGVGMEPKEQHEELLVQGMNPAVQVQKAHTV